MQKKTAETISGSISRHLVSTGWLRQEYSIMGLANFFIFLSETQDDNIFIPVYSLNGLLL